MAISPLNEHIRRIVLSGSIGEDTAALFLEQLTHLQYCDVTKPITIYIDTGGGSVHSGLLMYDAMMMCPCPIQTIGIGKVMSMGALILAAGDPGERYITKNTSIMIHQISGRAYGTMSEMDVAVDETRRLQEVYIDILSKHTGKTKKQLLEDMREDNYMTAVKAVDYGLADKVIYGRRVAPPKKTTKKKATKKKASKKKVSKRKG